MSEDSADPQLAKKCLALFHVNTKMFEQLQAMPNQVPVSLTPKRNYDGRAKSGKWEIVWADDVKLVNLIEARDTSKTIDELPFGITLGKTAELLEFIRGHAGEQKVLGFLRNLLEEEQVALGELESKYMSLQPFVCSDRTYGQLLCMDFLVAKSAKSDEYDYEFTSEQIIHLIQMPGVVVLGR